MLKRKAFSLRFRIMFRPCLPSDVSAQTDDQNHSGQQPADAADWQTVMASLAELGFQVQGEGTPAAADVVSAAQLRLRYWRRQLPCGDAGLTADEESGHHPQLTGVSDSQTNSQISALNGVPQPVAVLEQTSVSETFVRERIRSIKSARECLLVCSCRRVLSAPGGRLTATERHVLREAEDHGF
jgi:hypothetical protein